MHIIAIIPLKRKKWAIFQKVSEKLKIGNVVNYLQNQNQNLLQFNNKHLLMKPLTCLVLLVCHLNFYWIPEFNGIANVVTKWNICTNSMKRKIEIKNQSIRTAGSSDGFVLMEGTQATLDSASLVSGKVRCTRFVFSFQ